MSPPDPGRPSANRWLIAIAVMSSAIMEVLDTSVVNVSLPHIAGSMSASVDEATWVLTSYLIANAVILPISGWLANFIGRKRLLLTVVSGFTISSVLCGLAPSLGALIFFRVLQGTTGGGLQPLSQAVLLEEFPPEERGKAMAFWGLGIVAAPILGPTLGGWITDTYSWRWVFYINVPIGIFSLLMISLFLYDPPYIRRGTLRVDLWGLGMLAVGMGALQIMLDKGQEEDWFASHFIVTLAVIAAVMLTAFVIRELYTPQPIVRFRLLRYRSFAAGIVLVTVLGFVLYGSLVLLPLFMQTLLGWTAVTAGIWTSPRGVATALCMPLVGYLLGKGWDARWMLIFGFVVASMAFFGYSHMSLESGTWDILLHQINQGAGMAFVFVPLTIAHDGSDPQGGNRIRHQLVQRHAQYRLEHRHFVCDDVGGAAVAVPSVDSGRSCNTLRPAEPGVSGARKGVPFPPGFRLEHGGPWWPRRSVWHAPAAGGLDQLYGSVPDYGFPVLGNRSLGAAHEKGQGSAAGILAAE